MKQWVHDYNCKPHVHKEEAEIILSPKSFRTKQVYSVVYKDPRPLIRGEESSNYSLNSVRDVLELALHGGNTEVLNRTGFNMTLISDLTPCHSIVELSLTDAVKQKLLEDRNVKRNQIL